MPLGRGHVVLEWRVEGAESSRPIGLDRAYRSRVSKVGRFEASWALDSIGLSRLITSSFGPGTMALRERSQGASRFH
jgi:hypothetical protein